MRWRIFLKPIQTNPKNAENIFKATICLHNFLRQTKCASYCPSGFVDSWDETGKIKKGEWRSLVSNGLGEMLSDISPLRGSRPSFSAVEVRENLRSYVNSMEGSPWQWDVASSRGNVITN